MLDNCYKEHGDNEECRENDKEKEQEREAERKFLQFWVLSRFLYDVEKAEAGDTDGGEDYEKEPSEGGCAIECVFKAGWLIGHNIDFLLVWNAMGGLLGAG